MSLRDFTRIYYQVEKRGNQTLVYPCKRISWDPVAHTPAVQRPLDPSAPITIELWQMAEQSDVDEYSWGEKEPITVDALIDILIAESNITPWPIDGTDEQDEEGLHYEGRDARTFGGDEEVSLDDVRVAAYEEIDRDAEERIEDYHLITREDGSTVGLVLYPSDKDILLWEDETQSAETMSRAGITRRIDLSTLTHAVLSRYQQSDEWILIAALDNEEQAKLLATIHEDEGEEVAVEAIANVGMG